MQNLKNKIIMQNNFVKIHTKKDLLLSVVIIIAGIGLFFINKVAGIAIALLGILILIFYKTGYKFTGSDVILKHKKLEISRKYQQSVLDFLNGKSESLEMQPGNEGGTLLLEAWYNEQEGIAYAQLHTYQELRFQPITEVIELQKDDSQKLIEKL